MTISTGDELGSRFSIVILIIDLVSGLEFHGIDRMVYLSSVMVALF